MVFSCGLGSCYGQERLEALWMQSKAPQFNLYFVIINSIYTCVIQTVYPSEMFAFEFRLCVCQRVFAEMHSIVYLLMTMAKSLFWFSWKILWVETYLSIRAIYRNSIPFWWCLYTAWLLWHSLCASEMEETSITKLCDISSLAFAYALHDIWECK